MGRTPRVLLSPRLAGVRDYLERCVRIDARSLAVFRVFVGALVVADLLSRSRNFSFYYTESGVVPRSLAREYAAEYAFSVYHLTTDPTLIAALFGLQGLIALQLIVGYRTRIATVLTFLFVVSLDHHNPFVLSYADTLFRLLLFWAIFLPLGERWSVDAVHRERPARPHVASVASVLVLGQMVFMYVVNAAHKRESELWTGGEATALIMGLDEMTFLLGDTVRQLPPILLQIGTLAWFYMLASAWLLILLRGRPRLVLVSLFAGAHATFAVTVRIGAFAYVALAGLTLFLQAQFWRDGRALLGVLGVDPSRGRPIVHRLERFARRVPDIRVRNPRVRRARQELHTVTVTIVVVTMLVVALVFPLQFWLVTDADDREHRAELAMEETTGLGEIYTVAASVGIDQPGWNVFAPNPRTTDRYYVFPAKTDAGDRIDVYNERPLTFDRPTDELQTQHGTYRERFYMNSVRRGGVDGNVPVALAEHLCETWEGDDGARLTHLNMFEVTETVTEETIDAPGDRDRDRELIHRHGCGDREYTTIPAVGE